MSRVSFEHFGGRERRLMWARKDEEYVADFHLIARRVLDRFHYQVFSYHFLLGGDWRICCQRLHIDRGQFFHAVYRVQETLGRTFYELEPYGLYPPREYFAVRIVDPRSPRPVPPGGGPGPGRQPSVVLRGGGVAERERPPLPAVEVACEQGQAPALLAPLSG